MGKLRRSIDSSKKKVFQEVEIREAESVLFTLHNTKELYKVIEDCKTIIEKRGLIRSDQVFVPQRGVEIAVIRPEGTKNGDFQPR